MLSSPSYAEVIPFPAAHVTVTVPRDWVNRLNAMFSLDDETLDGVGRALDEAIDRLSAPPTPRA